MNCPNCGMPEFARTIDGCFVAFECRSTSAVHRDDCNKIEPACQEIAALRKRAEEAEANYRYMVEKACDEKRPAYDEQSRKLMATEDEIATLRAQLAERDKRVEVLEEELENNDGVPDMRAFVRIGAQRDTLKRAIQAHIRVLDADRLVDDCDYNKLTEALKGGR